MKQNNIILAGEPSCTMGFPASLIECFVRGRLIRHNMPPSVRVLHPQMKITCNRTLVRWRAAGAFLPWGAIPNVNIILSIWRKRGAESGIYDRMGTIRLGFCGNRIAIRDNNVFECTLPQNSRMSVQMGDIVGVEVTANTRGFQILYHRTTSEMRSYRFDRQTSSMATVRLSDSDVILTDVPQISLTVEPVLDNLVVATIATATQIPTTSISAMTIIPHYFQQLLPHKHQFGRSRRIDS